MLALGRDAGRGPRLAELEGAPRGADQLLPVGAAARGERALGHSPEHDGREHLGRRAQRIYARREAQHLIRRGRAALRRQRRHHLVVHDERGLDALAPRTLQEPHRAGRLSAAHKDLHTKPRLAVGRGLAARALPRAARGKACGARTVAILLYSRGLRAHLLGREGVSVQ